MGWVGVRGGKGTLGGRDAENLSSRAHLPLLTLFHETGGLRAHL